MNKKEDRTPDLRDYWQIILRGRWYILTSFVVILASTAFFIFTADPVYQSEAKIILEKSTLSQGNLSSILESSPLSGDSRNELQNRIEVLTSHPVLKQAKNKLEANKEFVKLREDHLPDGVPLAKALESAKANQESSNPGTHSDFQLITVQELKGRMEVRAIPDTDIIEIKATGGSAREAQLITNALVEAYQEQDMETSREKLTGIERFLETQLTKMKAQLESSEKKALQFQEKSGLVLGQEGIEKKLTKLEEMHAEASVELKDKKDQLETINKLLDTVKEDLLEKQLSGGNQPVITELQDKITQLKKLRKDIKELEEKRTQYLDQGNYIKAQQMEDKIVALRKKYEKSATEQFEPLKLLPRYEELIKKQLELKMEIEAAKNRVEVLDEKINKEVQKLVEHGLELLRLQRNQDVNKEIYTLLREEYERSRIAKAGELGGTRVVSWASMPEAPIKPRKKLNLLLAAIVGLTVGTGFSFLKEYMDTTIRTPDDVEDLGLVNLGTVLKIDRKNRRERKDELKKTLLTEFQPQSAVVDSYAVVEANIRFSTIDEQLRTILVTSPAHQEGKTTTTINLGLTYALAGKKILIVDCDLRKPRLHQVFQLPKEEGITNLALGEISLQEAVKKPYVKGDFAAQRLTQKLLDSEKLNQNQADEALTDLKTSKEERNLPEILVEKGFINQEDLEDIRTPWDDELKNFFVLTSGKLPPNPAEFLGSTKIEDLIQKLEDEFEVIIFDSPPAGTVADASMLATNVDGVILTLEAEQTEREICRRSAEQLKKAGANILGAVLNKVRRSASGYYYGYYGYGYGLEEDKAKKGRR